MENRLSSENCNKAKCKTCIFGPTPLKLPHHRIEEIETYLREFTSSHECHTTNKTCYGAIEFQAKFAYAMGIIPKPTAESFLETARTILGLK